MNQRWGPREVGLVHDESNDVRDDDSLVQLWLASDAVPPQVTEAAKAAFARHRDPATVLPVILDVRVPAATKVASRRQADLVVFGDGRSTIEVGVEIEVDDRTVTLRCTIGNADVEPSAVTVESPSADHPMTQSDKGIYRATGLPAGPLRVAVDFATSKEASVATTWFTA